MKLNNVKSKLKNNSYLEKKGWKVYKTICLKRFSSINIKMEMEKKVKYISEKPLTSSKIQLWQQSRTIFKQTVCASGSKITPTRPSFASRLRHRSRIFRYLPDLLHCLVIVPFSHLYTSLSYNSSRLYFFLQYFSSLPFHSQYIVNFVPFPPKAFDIRNCVRTFFFLFYSFIFQRTL